MRILWPKKNQPKDASEVNKAKIIEEIHMITKDIAGIESNFNFTSDFDLIDYYVHQLKAEKARQNYLIKKLRTGGVGTKEFALLQVLQS